MVFFSRELLLKYTHVMLCTEENKSQRKMAITNCVKLKVTVKMITEIREV